MGGRVLLLTFVTSMLTTLVVSNAYYKKKQFYPTVVYLLNSNRSLGVLYLQGFLVVWILCDLLKRLFFGSLRAAEVEHLIESLWYAVLETFILLAAFHQELNFSFVTIVMTLFVVKSFHWLANDRIDFMERSPLISWVFHLRAVSLLISLLVVDAFFVRRSWISLTTKGPSVEIVFGLEYAIMLLSAINTFAVYILHCVNLYSENSWENKPIYMRYVDIVLGFFKLLLYVSYMMFMLYVLFIPLHIARRVYITAKNFQKSLADLVNSRLAIRNLNTLCPDATEEELQEAHLCAICREEMTSRCKKLPCSHVFHTSCLRGWFQSQQSCPTCRMDVLNRATLSRMTRAHLRRNLQQQNNGVGFPPHPPAAPPQAGGGGGGGAGPGYPRQAPPHAPPHPHMMFPPPPPMMQPMMWPGMMAPPPQPHPLHQQQQQQQQQQQEQTRQAGGTGEANQPPSEGADQRDGSDTAATEDAGLGQRQQGDGQSTAHLAAAGGAAGGGASQQAPPTTASATNETQGPGVAPSSTDSSQQPAQGAYPPGFVPPPFPPAPPFMGPMPPPPAFFPSMPPFGFMGAPPPMGAGMPSGDALRALSDEELKTLEGMERANVEARIALLRDIQKLLDTAVTQLNQYSTVMAAMGSSGVAAGPGFPGYPAPPQSQLPVGTTTVHTTGSGSSTNPVPLSTATEEQGGGASSSSGAPPASTPASPSATNSLGGTTATSSSNSKRTGLFQSQSSYSSASQPLLDEPQGSFAFSARSLSIAASADGEAQEEEAQEQSEEEEVSTPQTSAHSANFAIGGGGEEEEEDVSMMEIRQRRLQRFHSSPVSPAPLLGQDSSGGGSGSCGTKGEEAGESGTASESRD